jgi:hypothetical protein
MKIRAGIAAFMVAMALATGAQLAAPAPADAGSCRPDHKPKADNRGNRWSTGWVCGNRRGAALFSGPDYVFKVSTMLSNPSWFVCYLRDVWHAGGNNVWYYTKGDRMAPGAGAAGNWGFMPAVDVWTSRDPWPGIPRCF